MKKITYEIERKRSGFWWPLHDADATSLRKAQRLLRACERKDPCGEYRIVRRTEMLTIEVVQHGRRKP